MALRVLLADESTTIKKVMQLALQDFAVEVKAVQSGLDVLEVARAFQPDIVFSDILLPKRTGYDVCADLKKDPTLKSLPVVLMWSSFMDLDERQYLNARANGKLEKPFDVEGLRSLILELVPKTQTQRLAHFLKFPASFVEPLATEEAAKSNAPEEHRIESFSEPSIRPAPSPMTDLHGSDFGGSVLGHAVTPPPLSDEMTMTPSPLAGLPPLAPSGSGTNSRIAKNQKTAEAQSSRWNMDSFDKLGNFTDEVMKGATGGADDDDDDEPVKITKLGTGAIRTGSLGVEPNSKPNLSQKDDDGELWSHQDLARFKLDIPEEDVSKDEISLVFDMDGVESPTGSDFLLNNEKGTNSDAKNPTTRKGEGVRSGTVTAIRGLPRLDSPNDNDDESGNQNLELEPVPKYEPIAQIRHADGELISQFSADSEASAKLELDRLPPEDMDLEQTVSGANVPVEPMGRAMERSNAKTKAPNVPNLTLEQLEAIVRDQSQDIIEALVRRLVPEIATEMIRKEIDRLLRESQGGSR